MNFSDEAVVGERQTTVTLIVVCSNQSKTYKHQVIVSLQWGQIPFRIENISKHDEVCAELISRSFSELKINVSERYQPSIDDAKDLFLFLDHFRDQQVLPNLSSN